jgi:hypothetical protein
MISNFLACWGLVSLLLLTGGLHFFDRRSCERHGHFRLVPLPLAANPRHRGHPRGRVAYIFIATAANLLLKINGGFCAIHPGGFCFGFVAVTFTLLALRLCFGNVSDDFRLLCKRCIFHPTVLRTDSRHERRLP